MFEERDSQWAAVRRSWREADNDYRRFLDVLVADAFECALSRLQAHRPELDGLIGELEKKRFMDTKGGWSLRTSTSGWSRPGRSTGSIHVTPRVPNHHLAIPD
jgi:hypothetical protein